MWIFTYSDSKTSYKKWLQPNNVYQLGRSSENVESSNFIYFKQIYISKEHLQIEVKSILKDHIYECDLKTPLLIKIQSRAITRINNEKVKLQKDEQPFVIDYTHENLMNLTFKEETAMNVAIEWIPFSISRYTKQIMVSGNLDFDPLTVELLKLFDNGIDLRIAKNPFMSSHYLTLSDHQSYGLKIALLRGIPILNTGWTDFIEENHNDFERWLLNIDPSKFLPFSKKDNMYLIPKKERTSLLRGSMFVIFHDNKDKLSKWISVLGGKIIKIDISKYCSEKNKIDDDLISLIKVRINETNSDNCYLMELNDPEVNNSNQIREALVDFLKDYDSDLVTEAMLHESVVSMSTGELQALNIEKKLKRITSYTEIGSTQPQRKRRKFKKVGITDFFDFKPPIKSESPSLNEIVDQNATEEQPTHKDDNTLEFASPHGLSDNKGASPEDLLNIDKLSNNSTNRNKNERISSTHKGRDDGSIKEEPALKKRKKESNIGKFIPQISLIDAIKSTKEKATENVRDELGIEGKDNDYHLNEDLHNLAIVETIDISIRNKKPVAIESNNSPYKDRKDFKAFKKNKLLKNDKRNFIEMQPVFVGDGIDDVVFESTINNQKDFEKRTELSNDFSGVMDDISGYKPYSVKLQDGEDDANRFLFHVINNELHEPTLFVPEDESQKETSSTLNTLSFKQNDAGLETGIDNNENNIDEVDEDDDDDDDDDDDQPKFAFSRS